MYKKSNLLILLILSLCILVYFLNVNIRPTTITKIIPLNSFSESKPLFPPITTKQIIPLNQAITKTCHRFEQAKKTDRKNKVNFISTKAILWYFEGYDKYKIAESLMVIFDYSVAMKWIDSINRTSRYDAQHAELIQSIDAINYSRNFSQGTPYIRENNHYQRSDSNESFDINQLLNQYPDLSETHWRTEFQLALRSKNVIRAINSIIRLKEYVANPVFFQHPISNINTLYFLSSFTKPEAKKIIRALFDLAPVYFDETYFQIKSRKEMLTSMGIDESLWNFKLIEQGHFTIDATIKQLIKEVKNSQSSFEDIPLLDDFCNKDGKSLYLTKIKFVKASSQKFKESLSPAWQGVRSTLCPEKGIINRVIEVKEELNKHGVLLDELGDYEKIQNNSSILKQALESLDESKRTMLFSILYMNTKLEIEQIEALINSKITPTNSNFYLLLRQLPLVQQKELLLENQYDLTHFDNLGVSLITNVIRYGRGKTSDELIPFIIELGFPLKQDESSPDPLWMELYLLSSGRVFKELPIRTISSLIKHTTLNDVHINIMHKIKNKNIELYEQLVKEFPKLKFKTPQTLIEISCQL